MRRHEWGGGPGWGGSRGWGGPGRGGAEAWQGFGRRIFFGFLFFFVFVVLGLVTIGALIATVVSDVGFVTVVLTPLVVIIVLTFVFRLGARTFRPVRDLIRAAGSLADGDYSARARSSGSRTMRPVVSSFNEMARRLEVADEERRQLLADLGHELRTPLTVVRGEIEAMLDGVHQPDPEHLELLLEEVAVMERLLEDLRTLSLAEAGALALHVEPTDLADLVDDVADSHRRTADAAGVLVLVDADESIGDVLVDPVRVREVVANLVVNALRAMPDGGSLRLAVRPDADDVLISVKDSGTGIAEEDLDSVFERFRKGSTSSGSGLGLTISRDLVEAHGGTIDITSRSGLGTEVIVRLPRR